MSLCCSALPLYICLTAVLHHCSAVPLGCAGACPAVLLTPQPTDTIRASAESCAAVQPAAALLTERCCLGLFLRQIKLVLLLLLGLLPDAGSWWHMVLLYACSAALPQICQQPTAAGMLTPPINANFQAEERFSPFSP